MGGNDAPGGVQGAVQGAGTALGVLTSELRGALARHKPALLTVLWRLAGMRSHDGQVPILCALIEARGGPGLCFSCGDPLAHPESYGRRDPCSIAAELYYSTVQDMRGEQR